MKLVVTILQCKRVSLPYIFLKRSLPQIQARLKVPVETILVQHVDGIPESDFLATSRLPDRHRHLVKEWTDNGSFNDAKLISVREEFAAYPHLPSVQKSAEASLSLKADYHLWIEDDAVVWGDEVERWPSLIPTNGVGAFKRKREGYINAAYFVSTPAVDARILECCTKRHLWDLTDSLFLNDGVERRVNLSARRLEAHITRLAAGRVGYLGESEAERVNESDRSSSMRLVTSVRNRCPEFLPLLGLDFPELVSDLI